MPVSKDVIRDLLPIYLAGEASMDTRTLVEASLAQDPELRALADASARIAIPEAEHREGLPALEVRTLNRTRQLLAWKSFVLGIALFLTFVPMTTVFRNGETVLLLARDYPDAASGLLLNAAIAWVVYLGICRRLRATGLESSRSRYSRVLWTLVGLALGVPTMLVSRHWAGGGNWPMLLPPLFAATAFAMGGYWAKTSRRNE